ncbi:beta-N-acetylhexosaminidase [Rhodospirillaceae bacterium KN72]|uniref:beta-N-acetylhexosaminidase n=1 Tax=Pacificispira spongiicola TaxID=2729598 RepID=A0A7Y0HG86_9PROT|nr:beta-N-acetylhexosaminidase [Pacificispira spongiicola]NMM44094.1 beta-N-acetylhexosaminidase [Pacificispira spongiicola]
MTSPVSAVLFGCEGLRLSDAERRFFADANPLGFILFARNVDTPDQIRALTADLRSSVGRADAPILIDQEGGRVQRLRPPHWRQAPTGRVLGDLYRRDADKGLRAIWLNYRLIARELTDLGIDVDCVPCLDIPVPGAHDVIGDRAYGDDADTVIACGRMAAQALLDGGVLPISKHIPGHGRSTADSHHDLPRVTEPLDVLEATDFVPFKALNGIPLGMTAHIVYDALDAENCATQSTAVIGYIRETLGFDGLLMSDDLSMRALGGSFADRARTSLAAGCDLVLHCNGDMGEMTAVMDGTGPLSAAAVQRWDRAAPLRTGTGSFDPTEALDELTALLAS